MTLREKIETMEAFERGEEIEIAYCGGNDWSVDREPEWAFSIRDYRIKPKKQTVTIEKWLVKSGFSDYHKVVEASSGFIKTHYAEEDKVKLLNTYEVEL